MIMIIRIIIAINTVLWCDDDDDKCHRIGMVYLQI